MNVLVKNGSKSARHPDDRELFVAPSTSIVQNQSSNSASGNRPRAQGVPTLFCLVVRAPVDKLFVDPDDPTALLIMFYDAGQFGFTRQVLVQVIKFVFVYRRNPVDAPMVGNLKQINCFR